jgi:predicted nucleotidyltransferase component of viral defense system
MITERSYYEEWIKQVLLKTRSTNYGLAEKMIYAFTLLEQLALNDMPFVFKGGTSLALLMPELHRFSKDIDIQMDKRPNNIENIFDGIVVNSPFNRWEHSQRESEFDVPKEHFKFYYSQADLVGLPKNPFYWISFMENHLTLLIRRLV